MRLALVYDCVYPYTLGGVEHRNAEIARRLAGRHGVCIFGFHYWQRDPTRRVPGVEYTSIGPPRDLHAGDGRRKISDALTAAIGTFKALLQTKCEVWDIANIAVLPVIAAFVAARCRRRGLVVTWHEFFGDHWNDYLGPRLGPMARRLEWLALRCSPRIIAVSLQTHSRLRAAGADSARLHYIPNGVDSRRIIAVPPNRNCSADVVVFGRLVPHKRVDLALHAFALLRQSRPTATLAIIGDGPERLRLEALSRTLQISQSVRFHGFLPNDDDVFAIVKACRVALLPSSREGFGLGAVQAWAAGRPVVVCDDPENATTGLVTDPRLGRIAPATAGAIAAATVSLLEDPDDAFRTAHAVAHYDFDAMIAAVESVYRLAERDRY